MTSGYKQIKKYECTKSEQTVLLTRGLYQFEAWGAQGGTCGIDKAGLGGYARGIFRIYSPVEAIIIVGGKGNSTSDISPGGYNGGGKSSKNTSSPYAGSGGGSTDILFVINGVRKKMLIAGAGGGCSFYSGVAYAGGNGGGLYGSDGQGNRTGLAGKGGKQSQYENCGIWSGIKASVGTEGKGGDGLAPWNAAGGGGGGGYFGGGGGSDIGAGGGGSSFISNDAIRKFMPEDMTKYGREGDGLAIISILKDYCTCKRYNRTLLICFFMITVTIKRTF